MKSYSQILSIFLNILIYFMLPGTMIYAGATDDAGPDSGSESSHGVTLNQTYLETALREGRFDISKPEEVFAHVFNALPDQVKVYPTENYFYFQFGHRGQMYSGNMRLDVKDRDDGVLHFAYFDQPEDWNAELITEYRPLNADDGVVVEKVEDLVYRVTFAGKSTLFHLNDLRNVRPAANLIADGEDYLGPVFDESGIRFFLMFSAGEKYFSFVLDEQAAQSDHLIPYNSAQPEVLLGMRTGFAFYQDHFLDRKILIGVYSGNVQNNNYFDGPFDQLPDNFLSGNVLRDAILTIYPDLEGEIDSHGNFNNLAGRVLVNPYINYQYLSDLDVFLKCKSNDSDPKALYRCLQPLAR
ncbi:MAG: hypothetical protein K8F25_11415 [Fimbriimonadaceae bacterium]|nr:hypothetical protein [Alphaproteobacteria bacterium]